MKRLTAIKLMCAALVGTALMPLSGLTAPSQADLDTEELRRIANSGDVIRDRTFHVNDQVIFRNCDIQRSRFIMPSDGRSFSEILHFPSDFKGKFQYNRIIGSDYVIPFTK